MTRMTAITATTAPPAAISMIVFLLSFCFVIPEPNDAIGSNIGSCCETRRCETADSRGPDSDSGGNAGNCASLATVAASGFALLLAPNAGFIGGGAVGVTTLFEP